ncbi:MAG: hypothetical protein A2017_11345 [Lentisphaerae bacterium GWF2_44_16]|nr:MAG: hypothetical protein A2017_11345 [Lentisphaerae bacterium GWF2_44_16]
MRLGILTDIHSNFEALAVSYEALVKAGSDKIICIGDIVGYGAKPKECIDFIREKNISSVKGNHDHYTAVEEREWDIQPYAREVIKWTRSVLDASSLEWLNGLPFKLESDGVLFVHSSLEALDGEYWPYVLDVRTALFHFFSQDVKFAFFGHTHIPLFFTYNEEHKISIEILKSRTVPKNVNAKYLINPGSVGQPRDFDSRSAVLLFDTETCEINLIRVPYDIRKVQDQIISAGLPRLLAERLSRGN